jgi:hypothetical protein
VAVIAIQHPDILKGCRTVLATSAVITNVITKQIEPIFSFSLILGNTCTHSHTAWHP